MRSKHIFITGLKIGVLTVLFFLCNAITSLLVGLGKYQQPSDPKTVTLATLFVSFLSIGAISYPIMKSRWAGWKLISIVFMMIFGIQTFLTQIETIVFLKYLANIVPTDMIPLLIVQGILMALLFSPLPVLILGKYKNKTESHEPVISIRLKELILTLLLIGVIYLTIYILLGMVVFKPLAGQAFDAYYGNLKLPQWIIPFQIVRGIIWAIIALPVIQMMKGEKWEKGLAVALLFSILMGALLLIPTGIMPDKIRISHFIEVASSNFVFGWIVVWLLNKKINSQEKVI